MNEALAADRDIEDYLAHFNAALRLYAANRNHEALTEIDTALAILPAVPHGRFNRGTILLALGRWHEGFAEWLACEDDQSFMRPAVRLALACGVRLWRGEDLRGKTLEVLHTYGCGDTIMTLRYVRALRDHGADVRIDVPDALKRIASQFAPTSIERRPDYACPDLHLLYHLGVTPETVTGRPYIEIDGDLVRRRRIARNGRRRIGIAWSVGNRRGNDFPREIPLAELVAALGDAELHSVQAQGADAARALGVHVHDFADFADCAALMRHMDEIVSIDTAALHLAGAIGHPRVFGLLSHWSSWRWRARWYDNVRLCRQAEPGDWVSALAQMKEQRPW